MLTVLCLSLRQAKAGSRLVSTVSKAMAMLSRSNPGYSSDNDFWVSEANSKQVPLRNRSGAPLRLRKASLLPPIEIAAAIRQVIADNEALSWEELPCAVALQHCGQHSWRANPLVTPAVPVTPTILRTYGRICSGRTLPGPDGIRVLMPN